MSRAYLFVYGSFILANLLAYCFCLVSLPPQRIPTLSVQKWCLFFSPQFQSLEEPLLRKADLQQPTLCNLSNNFSWVKQNAVQNWVPAHNIFLAKRTGWCSAFLKKTKEMFLNSNVQLNCPVFSYLTDIKVFTRKIM